LINLVLLYSEYLYSFSVEPFVLCCLFVSCSGILVVVALGVALGVAIGVLMLVSLLSFLRRYLGLLILLPYLLVYHFEND